MKKYKKKIFKIAGIFSAAIVILLLALNYFFTYLFNEQIKVYANHHLKSELNFRDTRLSFFNHFPSLTLTLYDFSLKAAPPFSKDTLIASKEIALGVNLSSLFSGELKINKVYLTDANIKVSVTEKGEASYDIYQSSNNDNAANKNEQDEFSLKIENVLIENASILYNDQSLPILINAKGFNYNGKGDLSKSIFDLASQVSIESFDFNFDNQYFFVSKKIKADLLTRINTNSLSFLFRKNDLTINQLPVEFTGLFEFLHNGYNMDFNVNATASDLKQLITAMPQEYIQWLTKTELSGSGKIGVKLSGKYIAENGIKPDLMMNASIRNGFIANENAPSPLKNLYFDFQTNLPGLNPDSLIVNIDSMSFSLDEGYFDAMLRLKGIEAPQIHAKVNAEIDLAKFQRAIGFNNFDVKGKYGLHFGADGIFSQKQNPKSNHPDSILASIPSFNIQSSLSNGYFKFERLEQPLKNISFKLNASCADNNYRNTHLLIENLNAHFLNNELAGFLKIKGGNAVNIDADLNALLRLSSIKKFYPLDSMDLRGDLKLQVKTNGLLDIDKKKFPSTSAAIKIINGLVKTKHYPKPVENIYLDAVVKTSNASLKHTHVVVKPISFSFEGHPFSMKLDLENFENVKYDVTSKGSIDLEKISKVFMPDGFHATGFIKTDFSLRGLQSDAEKGLYHKLHNVGSFELINIDAHSEYFPFPFHINKGLFSFKQYNIALHDLSVKYGHSDFLINGSVSNALNYFLHDDSLSGSVDLKSNYIDVNQFMSAPATTNNNVTATSKTSSGVIVLPPNLAIDFLANLKKIKFGELDLSHAKAEMSLKKGILNIKESGFTLIDAPVVMNATYFSIHPSKAYFDYHINAKEFDIKRAYNEIDIFRELVTAAGKAQGIVSLDYKLKGLLDGQMKPVLPSLEGEGSLSVLKAKIKGFKLLTAISKAAEKDSLNNPDVSNVEIKTSIKKNVIMLYPLKMKISVFRPKIQGETTFDGRLNLKFRLGLPPLGIIGVPFNVTGTHEKPIVKLGRGKNNEALKETTEDDW